MSMELVEQQASELTILKQQNEILSLKLELQKTQAQKISKLEDSLLSPKQFKHYKEVAEYLSKTTLVPKNYIGKPGDIFIAMEMGYQIGLPMLQALQDIGVINGRPVLYGDGLLAVIMAHPDHEYINEGPILNDKGQFIGYECKIKRKGHEEHIRRFTLQDAQKAGLLGKSGPWQQYPEQMCRWRAVGFGARAKFPDALRGIRLAEEVQDYINVEYEHIKPTEGSSQTEKLKNLIQQQTIYANETEEPKESKEIPAHESAIDRILELMIEKNFTDERKEKAFAYYKIEKLEDLTEEMANKFIEQLEKS